MSEMTKEDVQQMVNESLANAMNHLMTDKVSLVTLATNLFGTLGNTLMEYVQNQSEYNKTLRVFRKYEPGAWRVNLTSDHELSIWCQDSDQIAECLIGSGDPQTDVEWQPVPLPATKEGLSSLVITLIHQGVPYDKYVYAMNREMAIDHMVAARNWMDERAAGVREQMATGLAEIASDTE